MAEFEIDGIHLVVPDEMLNPKLSDKLSTGGYEAHEAHAARMRLREGQRVLELGSGIGYIASVCASITGAGNVTTVEGNPNMLPVIRGNLERNGFGAATVLHGAVGGMKGAAEPIEFDNKKTFWAARIADMDTTPDSVVSVPHLGLGDLLKTYRPHVVIMDIEGAEEHLFDAPWPAFVRAVMMELHPGRYSDVVIKRIVDCMSVSGLTYDPLSSRGRILGFRRVRDR
ncbi:methyltransferase, FkbM family [Roseovarius marisflavi]|uniref:Methyltransferase, FkbM family n=1 Tax=Roseovarius marisflavi TaxID=1054996 RepID=A0A1M6ZTJ1_9RHOB|nr:FkbM family methyltransferase [Roseovarius marisflavi]SHL33665.1 methyltransferase, FkbM family [Roseovarius marisflavi]